MGESEQDAGMTRTMQRLWFLRRAALVLVCGLVAAAALPAHAAPLDPQACEQLQGKLDDLRKAGVETDMALGVEKARTTLPIERFNRIGAYIEIDEQLNFRCGLAKARIVLPTTIEGGEEELPPPAEATGSDGQAAPPLPVPKVAKGAATGKANPAAKAQATPPKRRPAVAKAKDASAPSVAPSDTPAATTAPAANAAPKAAKKKATAKKPDDAYRPPPKPVAGSEKKEPATKQ
jgi:hypothetical protein